MNSFEEFFRALRIDRAEIREKDVEGSGTKQKLIINPRQKGKVLFEKVKKVNAGWEQEVIGGNFVYPENPQEELNLHGMYLIDAENETRKFLDRCKRVGFRKVLVITGKGRHSDGGVARIRPVVAKMLVESIRVKQIRNFEFADGKHGGFGAYYVYF